MELLSEIANRKSIRSFVNEPLPKEAIERILEAGRRAPSAKNRQAWRFVLVTDQTTRNRIKEAAFHEEYVADAPAIIAVCTTNIDYQMPNGQLSYPVDLAFAASFMLLQAEHEGLGSCILTTYREADVKAVLSVPYRMRVVVLLLVGKAKETPELGRRFPLSRVVGYQHW